MTIKEAMAKIEEDICDTESRIDALIERGNDLSEMLRRYDAINDEYSHLRNKIEELEARLLKEAESL